MSSITPDQVKYKKRVGTLNGSPVFEVGLIGGLHLIMKSGEKEPLGAGPHRAVAQHIAKKRNPDIIWTELSKSDWIEPEFYMHLVPEFEDFTDRLGALARE